MDKYRAEMDLSDQHFLAVHPVATGSDRNKPLRWYDSGCTVIQSFQSAKTNEKN